MSINFENMGLESLKNVPKFGILTHRPNNHAKMHHDVWSFLLCSNTHGYYLEGLITLKWQFRWGGGDLHFKLTIIMTIKQIYALLRS